MYGSSNFLRLMEGAAKLGIAINVGHIGSPREHNGEHFAPPTTESITDECLVPLSPDEDALLFPPQGGRSSSSCIDASARGLPYASPRYASQ